MARISDASRVRVNEVAVKMARELADARRLVTINRLLCLAALCGWAATLLFGQ